MTAFKEYDISVIIPVYNVAEYLEDCVKSVLRQSKKNIEIICIDDCSTDDSLKILEKMASEDNRVYVIKNDNNRGRLYARKRGVMAAEGKYIMFLDGDDFYSDGACETAYNVMIEHHTDILQFGMNIINAGNAPLFEVDSFSRFVIPYEGRIVDGKVLRACFDEEKYNYNLVNKIYKSDLCKKAFSWLDDAYYCMAEDMLAYFLLAYFARSYIGIADKLYNYNFAIGISKPGSLDLNGLDKRCCGADSISAVKKFLEKQGTFEEFKDIYIKMERRILSDNFDAWYYRLPFEEREQGYHIFEKHWGKDKVILGLLYDIENKQYDINQKGKTIEDKNHELEDKKCIIENLNNAFEKVSVDLTDKEQIISQLYQQVDLLKEQLNNTLEERDSLQKRYNHTLHSISYKLGSFVTWFPRKCLRLAQKLKE